MRVLQLIDHMGSGGAQTIVYDLARLLPGSGVDVEVAHLYAPNIFAERLEQLGVPTHDLSTGSPYSPLHALDPRAALRLRELLRTSHYDVVNLHLYVAPLHLRLATPRAMRPCAVVNTVHAHREELPRYVFPSYRLTRSRTDMFVGDFDCSRAELMSIGVAEDRIEVIHFGVDPIPEKGDDVRSQGRRALGISPEAPVLLSVARLHPQRFIDRFIHATACLRDAVPDMVLLLAGDGEQRDDLEAMARSLGIGDHVRFLGRRSDLDALAAVSDVYLSVARNGDVGIAALQAMSAGLPCIAWDNAGLHRPPDAAGADYPVMTAGALDTFTDGIRTLLHDPARRRELGHHSSAFVRNEHSAERMARSYADLYRRLA